jgi:hypothetical protein
MSIGLIIDELTDECALVLESHLALTNALIVHEFTFIYVSVLEIVNPAAVSLRTFEVTFKILAVLILILIEQQVCLPRS